MEKWEKEAIDIKRFAKLHGADLVGIASVSRLRDAPSGYRPMDIQPDANSLISMAIHIPWGAVQANKAAHRRREITCQFIYMQFGYITLNESLNKLAYQVARELKRMGHRSTMIPASFPYDVEKLRGVLSHRHAAVAAGLGEFGWCSLVLTPCFGPRQRFVTVLTSANLKPDPLYNGGKLCDTDKCRICVDVCPVNAIPQDEFVSVKINGKTYRYAKLDKWKCRVSVNIGPPYFFEGKLEVPREMKPGRFLKLKREINPWIKAYGEAASVCGRCLVECPVGTD